MKNTFQIYVAVVVATCFSFSPVMAQKTAKPAAKRQDDKVFKDAVVETYKTVGQTELKAWITWRTQNKHNKLEHPNI